MAGLAAAGPGALVAGLAAGLAAAGPGALAAGLAAAFFGTGAGTGADAGFLGAGLAGMGAEAAAGETSTSCQFLHPWDSSGCTSYFLFLCFLAQKT